MYAKVSYQLFYYPRKIRIFLISILVIILTAYSSIPTKNAQGKQKNEDGIIFTIKVIAEELSMKGSIEDDDNRTDLTKIKLDDIEGEDYIKV